LCDAPATSSPPAPFCKDDRAPGGGNLGADNRPGARRSTFSLPADAPRAAAGPGLPRLRPDPRRPGPPCPRTSGIMRATRGAQNRLRRGGRRCVAHVARAPTSTARDGGEPTATPELNCLLVFIVEERLNPSIRLHSWVLYGVIGRLGSVPRPAYMCPQYVLAYAWV